MNNPSPLEVIFFAALEKGSPEERATYLDRACAGDPDLRGRVEKMLTAQAQAGSFLEQPARSPVMTVDEASVRNGPGTVIGPYKLLEQIGEGGFGVVFLAEQTEPVRRKVALKILKPGMDTRQVVARFEAERQALAIMDHPHIAKVLDGGATSSGRPYFVMELVKGVPITEFCDQNHLTPPQRLQLFISVCQAVQHAHQKGIIHRDLKPSNVLVSRHDTTPIVKVIDFGVAKALGHNLTDKTLFTGIAQMVGTPLYMSPEQAGMSDLDVDTRSDIYSLGVLLYELLTGTTPFTKERFQEAAYDEIRRIIREEEPPKPSTRLSESKDSLPSISAQRQTEPAKLTKLVRGELDWIVMKALEKDRNRRYESASAFAADVQRYLADEPVLACPPSAVYRLRKFARRNRAGLVLAGLILFFIVVLGGGAGWVFRDRAAQRAQIGTDIDRALRDAQVLQQQQRWPEALALVKHAQALLTSGGDEDLRQQVHDRVADLEMMVKVEDARLRWSAVKDNDFDFEASEAAYAQAFREYGVDVEALDPKAAGTLLQARDIRVELAAALDGWARVLRRQGKSVWKDRLAAARATDTDPFRDRVREAVAGGDRKALEKLAEDDKITDLPPPTLDIMALVLELKQAVALVRKAQRRHPGDFWINLNLASYLNKLNPEPLDEVIRYASVAKALRPQSAIPYFKLGRALVDKGRLDEAIAEWSEAIRLQDNALTRFNLVLCQHWNLGFHVF
jgi:serine/threonine protein kinase